MAKGTLLIDDAFIRSSSDWDHCTIEYCIFPKKIVAIGHAAMTNSKIAHSLLSTIAIDLPRIEPLHSKNIFHKMKDFSSHINREARKPQGTGNDQAPKGKKRSRGLKDFFVFTGFDIFLPESPKQHFERAS